MVTLVEAPRGLDLPVGVGRADRRRRRPARPGGRRGYRRRVLPARRRRRRRARLARPAATRRAPAAIFVKEPSDALVARAVAAGTAVVAVEPRARWERLYRLVDHVFEHHGDRADPRLRLRHRPVRAGPVDRRPHARHGQHRGRPVARAGLLRVQRRGRRAAPAVDPRPRRAARAPRVDRPVGHLRRAARQPATSSGSPRGPSSACGRGSPSASTATADRRRRARLRRARSGCRRAPARWPTMPTTCCAAPRCWRRGSCPGWPRRRPPTRCGCRNCSGCAR